MSEIAIVGGGLMGHGIALAFALGGHRVRITDTRAETLAALPGLMESALASLVEGGLVDSDWNAERLAAAVAPLPDLAATVRGADLVIEAITEKPDLKERLFAEFDRLCGPETIIASNTSYLDPFPLIPAARRARALVMHWYTPAYIVDLVDVVPGPDTDPAVVERARGWVESLGQVPIVLKRFVPGYVANRIQSAIAAEVYDLLDTGVATPREIDDAIIHGLSLRIPILGHLAKADFTGLDLQRQALLNATYRTPETRARSETLDALCAAGNTGVMSGRGYFDWGDRDPADLFRERDRRLIALKKAMKAIGPLTGGP